MTPHRYVFAGGSHDDQVIEVESVISRLTNHTTHEAYQADDPVQEVDTASGPAIVLRIV